MRKEAIPFQNFHMTAKFSGGKLHLSKNALVSFCPENKLTINRVQFHAKFSHRSFFYVYVNKETSHPAAFRTSVLSSMPDAWLVFKGNRLSQKIKIKKFPVLQVTRAPHTLLFTFSRSRMMCVYADGRNIFRKKIQQKKILSVSFLAGDNEVTVDDVSIQGRDAAGATFAFFDDFSFKENTADFLLEVFVLLLALSVMACLVFIYLRTACGLSSEEIFRGSRRKLQPVFFLLAPCLFLFMPFPVHLALLLSALIIMVNRLLNAVSAHSARFLLEPALFPDSSFAQDARKIIFFFIACSVSGALFQRVMLRFDHEHLFSSKPVRGITRHFTLNPFYVREFYTKPLTAFQFHADVLIPPHGVAGVDFLKKTAPVPPDETFRTGLAYNEFYTLILSCDADFPSQLFFVSDVNIKPSARLPRRSASLACGKWNSLSVKVTDVFIEVFVNHQLLLRTLRQTDTFVRADYISFLSLQGTTRVKNFQIYPPAPPSWLRDNVSSIVEALFYVAHILCDLLCFVFLVALFSKALSLTLRADYKSVFKKVLWCCILLALAVGFSLPMRKTGHAYGFYVLFLIISAVFFACFIGLHEKSRRRKNFITALFVIYFVEASSVFYAPYISQAKTPWYSAARSSKFYWFLDPQVRVHNNFFALYRLRGRLYDIRKNNKKHVTRIATLGGSQTWGEGIPILSRKIFAFQLEDKINALPQTHPVYEVINGASGAANSFSQLVFFKGVLLPFKPSLSILNFSHNDAAFDRGSLKQYARFERQDGPMAFYDKSLTLSLVHSFLSRAAQSIWGVFVRRFVVRAKGNEESKAENFRADLRAFCALSRKHRFSLLFLLEPYYIVNKNNQDPQIKKMYEVIREEGKECGAPVLDMFSIFYKHRDEDLFLDGLHLSEGGHELMADEIMKFFLSRHPQL